MVLSSSCDSIVNFNLTKKKTFVSVINQNGGFEYVLAPLYKRFFAEVIDVVILFILKLIVAFMIIDIFEIDL